MTNSDIISTFELTAKLLELHGGDEMRIKAFTNANYNLERYAGELQQLNYTQLTQIQGVGKMIASSIIELVENGTLKTLEELYQNTPEGVIEMFKIKGLGVKKIKVLWNELGIDNLNELQIACENGTIAKTKGFGEKTQLSILESLVFIQSQAGKLRMNKAHELSQDILEILETLYPKVAETGQVRRNCEEIDTLQFLVTFSDFPKITLNPELFIQDKKASNPFCWRGKFMNQSIDIEIIFVEESKFNNQLLLTSANELHLKIKNEQGQTLLGLANKNTFDSESAIYERYGSAYIVPEMREGWGEFDWAKKHAVEDLVTYESLKGILHNHSTYSDGRHTLRQMAEFCKSLGFEYFGIADHSQTATYANGLLISKVMQQHEEIDKLNTELAPFKILKGIESDILNNGSLDYPDEVLASFDYIVASVHSNLSMNLEKATERIIKAVENPYTTILGHPTSRLLLSRKGYPLDFKKVIDACAANGVVMEINASPYRLDIDWRWIQYCLEKGVMLSINPDAHEMEGFFDMHYGVAVARKGGLLKEMTFNALSLGTIQEKLNAKQRI